MYSSSSIFLHHTDQPRARIIPAEHEYGKWALVLGDGGNPATFVLHGSEEQIVALVEGLRRALVAARETPQGVTK